MRVPGAIDAFIAGNLIGFTVGLVISILLLALTIRSAKLPGTAVANIVLAIAALLWNAGGMAQVILNPQSIPNLAGGSRIAGAIQFTGAAIWPIPMLAIWRYMATGRWQGVCWRTLQGIAFADAAVIIGGIWAIAAGTPWIPLQTVHQLSAYGATFLGLAAGGVFLRSRAIPRTLSFSSAIVLTGLLLTSLAMIVETGMKLPDWGRCVLGVTGQQAVLLVIVGSFFLFSRFRFADVFIGYSVRLLLAGACASVLILVINAPFIREIAARAQFPRGIQFFLMAILATAILGAFAPLDRRLGQLVNRWGFQAPDFRNAVRELGEALRRLYSEPEVTQTVERAVSQTLALEDVRSIPLRRLPSGLWPAEIQQGEIIELDRCHGLPALLSLKQLEVLVPVRAEGRVHSILAISPGPARRGLVSSELRYLRSVAEQLGSRLDLLRLEREMMERQSREAVLLQQVTEAELRALRAQINPHFLFNSLNSIANLIVTDPARAEIMTLRLAKVFRHVLAHTSRPLAPIQDEMDFLRSYLEIEEARFGSRLRVEIDVAPEVALDPVPSLILQPVVENALKHGLAPKTGPGRIWISAKRQGDQICLAVEDDGVGPDSAAPRNGDAAQTAGVGLKNIRQRLATLYHERAQVSFEARCPEGTRVTLLVPRDSGRNGDEKPHS
jgi:two-component system, LytTR family, sensor kinase